MKRRKTLISAPIQNANKRALIPRSRPKRKPMPMTSFPSPRPIHVPFERYQRRKNGIKNKIPAKTYGNPPPIKSPLMPYKKIIRMNVTTIKEKTISSGMIVCLKSYTAITTRKLQIIIEKTNSKLNPNAMKESRKRAPVNNSTKTY